MLLLPKHTSFKQATLSGKYMVVKNTFPPPPKLCLGISLKREGSLILSLHCVDGFVVNQSLCGNYPMVVWRFLLKNTRVKNNLN